MFTGIIEAIGQVGRVERKGADARLVIETGKLALADVKKGDSISVSGVCLTVVTHAGNALGFDVSGETLSRTTLGKLRAGSAVNLEKALLPTTRLGGHLVSGHVDGIGKVADREEAGESIRFRIDVPTALARYIAEKGSVCVDGVSLTVNEVQDTRFEVNIVPHTQRETTLGKLADGAAVNIEVDLVARYIERLLQQDHNENSVNSVTQVLLEQYGFLK